MNTRAYNYEGLIFEAEDFLPARKNLVWTYLGNLASQLKDRIQLAEAVRRERVQLSMMSNRLLKDIGITRIDARQEFNRRYLDVAGIRH